MGSATVDIAERWRPWLDSGVTHILGPLHWVDVLRREGAAVASAGLPDTRAGAQISAATMPAKSFSQPSSGQAFQSPVSDPSKEEAGDRSLEPSPEQLPRGAFPSAATGQRSTSVGAGPVPQRPLPTRAWPDAWKTAWGRTGFARPFLWTYAQLGEDLLGTPAPERREALKKVLAALNLGPVHNFWPFSEPDGQGGLRPQAKLFREGLTFLAPKCVIFLGTEEVDGVTALGEPELFKVTSYLDAGVLCVHLPDIGELVAEQELLNKAVALFREKLTHLI